MHPVLLGWVGVFATALLAACGGDAPNTVIADTRVESKSGVGGSITARVHDHQWLENAEEFQGRVGAKMVYHCGPGRGPAMLVWGTDIYSDDSFVCWAAVHAGAMKVGEAASAIIEILPGQARYQGSERNGVNSMDWNTPWEGSFRVVGREWIPCLRARHSTSSGFRKQVAVAQAALHRPSRLR